jgi:hypothetical protein
MLSFELGAPHAGAHPLDDQIPFQLGDGADDHHHRPPQRSAGVDIFPEADELDLEMIQFIQDLKEVADGAGQAIEGPDHDNLEPAMPGISQQLVEAGALCLRAANLVGVFLDDLVATLLRQLPQIVELRLRVLIEG